MSESSFSKRKILITGGLGFIGSNLARRLVQEGASVTVVDSLIPEYGGNLANLAGLEGQVRVNISDIRDEPSMRYLVRGVDYLFNLAGQTSHLDSMRDPFTDLEINCRAQLSILEVCRQYNPELKIVYAGTRQVYGRPDSLPVDERHPCRPTDANGIHKLAGEWYHLLYHQVYGLRACSLRLTNTFGPRMRVKDARQTFVGIWIRRLVEGEPFEVWGGDQLRDLTYVDDAVEAMLLAAQSEAVNGRIFNLGGPCCTLRDLADLLIRIHGRGSYELRDFPNEARKIDIGSYYADDSLFRSTCGWEPRTTLPEGLFRTLDYYSQHLPEYV